MEIKSLKGLEKKMAALHNNWLGKREGPNFLSSYNQWGFKPGISGLSAPGSGRAPRTRHRSERRQSSHPRTHSMETATWSTPRHTAGRLLACFRVCPGKAAFSERPLWGQRNRWPVPFPCRLAQGKYRATGRNRQAEPLRTMAWRIKWPGHGRAHPGHTPRSGRPWGTEDTAWQGTVVPLLQKAIPLENRRKSWLSSHTETGTETSTNEKTEEFIPNERRGRGHSHRSKWERSK